MKNIKRLILGLVSSLLFVTGFVQAADSLDPLSQGQAQLAGNSTPTSAPDCSHLCDIVDPNA